MTAHKTGNLKHIVQPAGCSAGWRVSLPGDSFGQNLFHVVGLVSDFSRQLVWSQSHLCSLFSLTVLKFGLTSLRGTLNFGCLRCHGGLSDHGEFQELPEAF